ncbi:hypothetical protein [Acinetobacter sp. ANC 4639]
MKVKYFWRKSDAWKDGVLRPSCDSSETSEGFKGLVFSFLNDDEGLGVKYLIDWIDEGLIQVQKIKDGVIEYYDMWGHAWGAEITKNNVLIYWGYDDNKFEEYISFECFYKILKKWSEFLKAENDLNNIVEFEC